MDVRRFACNQLAMNHQPKHQSRVYVANDMALPQHTSHTISARVMAAYSDAKLDKYFDEHRLAGGAATIVVVEDPENLPESFIQRLR